MEDKSTHNDDRPLHLPITLGYEILIEIPDLEARIKSVLVGMEHNQYIIVKIFTNDLLGVFNREEIEKSPITVMYRHKGAVYMFETGLQHLVTFPARLLILKYPKQIKEHCVPEKIRHECNLPCQTMIGNDIIEMFIVDISQNGCLCIIKTAGEEDKGLYELIHVDKRIDIMTQFQDNGGRCDLVGIIRNASKDTDKIQLGIMFDNIQPVVRQRIEDYIASIS